MVSINRAAALQFIEAMSKADRSLADPVLAPEAYTISKGFGHFAGVRSREVMVGTIEAFNDLLPGGLRLAVSRVIEGDDCVIVECEGNATTPDGTAYHNQYCFIFTMQDGLIARVDEYFCNVLADRVLWPLVASYPDEALLAQ
ncbi:MULTISPECIES: nuclear transport factor 2 family protein [unclassified Novosphingobium]|uniref:nuclear transport factor 2 family protein n=1 Tax=unclassified Novosphingobium TaxID=2644732 RepID=UPI00135A6C71|nr:MULTISPECIES: nuclear transport factor 2 family protein [unclassified Novosphingobium]